MGILNLFIKKKDNGKWSTSAKGTVRGADENDYMRCSACGSVYAFDDLSTITSRELKCTCGHSLYHERFKP
jgi:DNA-directed RNA polymerase subunit RPC12/RpoP